MQTLERLDEEVLAIIGYETRITYDWMAAESFGERGGAKRDFSCTCMRNVSIFDLSFYVVISIGHEWGWSLIS